MSHFSAPSAAPRRAPLDPSLIPRPPAQARRAPIQPAADAPTQAIRRAPIDESSAAIPAPQRRQPLSNSEVPMIAPATTRRQPLVAQAPQPSQPRRAPMLQHLVPDVVSPTFGDLHPNLRAVRVQERGVGVWYGGGYHLADEGEVLPKSRTKFAGLTVFPARKPRVRETEWSGPAPKIVYPQGRRFGPEAYLVIDPAFHGHQKTEVLNDEGGWEDIFGEGMHAQLLKEDGQWVYRPCTREGEIIPLDLVGRMDGELVERSVAKPQVHGLSLISPSGEVSAISSSDPRLKKAFFSIDLSEFTLVLVLNADKVQVLTIHHAPIS